MTSSVDEFASADPGRLGDRNVGPLVALADPGTFRALPEGLRSEVTCGTAQIRGVSVACYATDGSRRGGALTPGGSDQIVRIIELARREGKPVVGVWHSGGASLRDGSAALDGIGRVFRAIVAASGIVPQVSVVLGPAAGGAAYGPALTDFVVMSAHARIFVTGPRVVAEVTGQDVSAEALGGPGVHAKDSGVAHIVGRDTPDTLARVAQLVELLGCQRDRREVHLPASDRDPSRWLPESPRRAYDIRPLVGDLLGDPGGMLVLHEQWAPNVLTALGRLAGRTVGVVANNPIRLGGCLNAAAGDKAARFVRTCDSYGIPLVVLVDVPGYLPGRDEERGGVVRRGAKLLHAFAAARIPRITVLVRKAYGGAYIAMNSKALGATSVLAWPSAEIGIMNPGSAVDILHRRELAAPVSDEERTRLRESLIAQHSKGDELERAVKAGAIDAVIEPASTHAMIAALLADHAHMPSKLPNIPL
jgi:acetyl-CoA/propionyl-CoA carboxylase carboxyl transferase subunit